MVGEWTANISDKLRKVNPYVKPWKITFIVCRREETTLARLRIGHARYSHGYLMDKGAPPYCDDCIVPLSVEHVLMECRSYIPSHQ